MRFRGLGLWPPCPSRGLASWGGATALGVGSLLSVPVDGCVTGAPHSLTHCANIPPGLAAPSRPSHEAPLGSQPQATLVQLKRRVVGGAAPRRPRRAAQSQLAGLVPGAPPDSLTSPWSPLLGPGWSPERSGSLYVRTWAGTGWLWWTPKFKSLSMGPPEVCLPLLRLAGPLSPGTAGGPRHFSLQSRPPLC